MKYGKIESLIHVIESREQEKQQQFLGAAQQEADLIAQKILEDGKHKVENKREKFQKELAAKREQEITKIKMQEQQKLNLYQQELILKEIERVQDYCEQLSAEEYLQLLEHHLNEHRGNPIIIVPKRYEEIVRERWRRHYQVEASEEVRSGFVLSYPEYDFNHDFSQLFQFKKQELLKRMMQILFEDERL